MCIPPARSARPGSSRSTTRAGTTSVSTGRYRPERGGAGPGAHSLAQYSIRRERAPGSALPLSEHAVVVGGLLGDGLDHVPVFDDLAVLQLEDVDDGGAARARLAHGV